MTEINQTQKMAAQTSRALNASNNDGGLVYNDMMKRYDDSFAAGSDKSYPNIELVRLEMTFFNRKPGKLLEYAFGSGVNTIHMAEKGYDVYGLDAAPHAKRLVERKLQSRTDIQDKIKLNLISSNESNLNFDDASFDYIVVMSLLSLLGSHKRVDTLLSEFSRVLKPGGKIIADVNSAAGDFALESTYISDDIYEHKGNSGNLAPVFVWCPKTPDSLVEIMSKYFKIDDIGYIDHKYMTTNINEFIVCGHKKT